VLSERSHTLHDQAQTLQNELSHLRFEHGREIQTLRSAHESKLEEVIREHDVSVTEVERANKHSTSELRKHLEDMREMQVEFLESQLHGCFAQ